MTVRHPPSVRALDITGSLLLLLLSAPLWPVIALAVRLTSPGPILFRGRRMAAGGTPFEIVKFRTMRAAPPGAPTVTASDDRRITTVGRVLRATKADELPQLWNVLRGDMALVGPRPEDPCYRDAFTPDIVAVLAYRPGLTGAASLEYRHEEALLAAQDADGRDAYYRRVVLPAKARLDLAYLERRTVRTDLATIAATVRAVLRRSPEAVTT